MKEKIMGERKSAGEWIKKQKNNKYICEYLPVTFIYYTKYTKYYYYNFSFSILYYFINHSNQNKKYEQAIYCTHKHITNIKQDKRIHLN